MSMRRLQKELDELTTITPLENARVKIRDHTLLSWSVFLKAEDDGIYKGGIFKVHLDFSTDYPFKPPKLKFLTKIYHPNIDSSGAVCLGILGREHWKPTIKAFDIITHLLDLINNPDPSESLQLDIGSLYSTNKEEFCATAREWAKKYCEGSFPSD